MRRTALLLALPLLVSACGGSKDPKALNRAGEESLAAGDSAAAAESFSKALEALGTDTNNTDYTAAKLGLAEALIASDPKGAKDTFLAVAREKPDSVQDDDFHLIATKLADANHLPEATEVLGVGIAAFPESPHLVVLRDSLGDRAKASGNDEALEGLKGLGYVGE
jgi:hypothetical protein